VETALEEREHLFAGPTLPPIRLGVVGAELALEDAVDATDLLLLAKPDRVLAELDATLAVLTRRVRAAGVRALLGVAALTLEVELHALAAAELANGTNITSHCALTSDPAPLRRTTTVVRDRRHVADER